MPSFTSMLVDEVSSLDTSLFTEISHIFVTDVSSSDKAIIFYSNDWNQLPKVSSFNQMPCYNPFYICLRETKDIVVNCDKEMHSCDHSKLVKKTHDCYIIFQSIHNYCFKFVSMTMLQYQTKF